MKKITIPIVMIRLDGAIGKDTVYKAKDDLFARITVHGSGTLTGYASTSNPPNTIRVKDCGRTSGIADVKWGVIIMPVPKNYYFKYTFAATPTYPNVTAFKNNPSPI
jgi:hypothetical protein